MFTLYKIFNSIGKTGHVNGRMRKVFYLLLYSITLKHISLSIPRYDLHTQTNQETSIGQ